MHRYRKRPASMLISAILASIMFIIIANSFMNLWGNSFTTLTAAKTATQAQAYSDIVSEKIKLEGTDAEEVTTKTKLSEITGNDSDDDWFYTYEIENETEDDNGNVFKVASIKIYKDDENSPRYSTEIPLSSLGSSKLNEIKYNKYGYYCEFPNGLLIQWGRGKCYEYQRYPIPFTTAVSPVVSGGGKGASMVDIGSFSANGFSAHLSDGYGQHDSFYWIAIGY